MKCIVCKKDILEGDIFVIIEIDMRRLIYSEIRSEKNFLEPYGHIHSRAVLPLCESCGSEGLTHLSPKDVAAVLDHIR
jgi:hypothetical protein